MNIVVVTHYYPEHGGGIEKVAAEIVARLIARGARVTWAASAPAAAMGFRGITMLPMRSSNLVERRFGVPYPLWSTFSLAALSRAVRRCDVLHLHDSLYMGNVAAYMQAAASRKPIVVTQHVGDIPFRRRCAKCLLRCGNATLAKWVLGGSTRTVFCSVKVQRYFSAQVRFRVQPVVIANGVDSRRFSAVKDDERRRLRAHFGWPDDRPLLLFVGRFVEKKGLHVIRELAARFRHCTWVLAGAGVIKPSNWALPHVHELGWVRHDALPDLYRAADLLVLPSVGEGFPLVVQEAMACGTPALISDDTALGCPGIESLSFTSEPEVGPMAKRLAGLLEHPQLLEERRCGVASYATTHWNWDVCAARYAGLLEEVVREYPPYAEP